MIKIDVHKILNRVMQEEWQNEEELRMVTEMIIEDEAALQTSAVPGRAMDIEHLFEHTEAVSKKVQALALQKRNKQ